MIVFRRAWCLRHQFASKAVREAHSIGCAGQPSISRISPARRTFMLSLLRLSAFLAGMGDALPPRVNYIFVDFENVHETDLDRIAQKPVKVILILGEHHKRLPVALVRKLLQYAAQVQLVETGRSGKNASDLVLANYIGEVKKVDPHGYIHILSKDKDFDALIDHYKMMARWLHVAPRSAKSPCS